MKIPHSPYFDENMNPCVKEQVQSMTCMEKSDYDKDKCTLAFDNYRFCLRFWDSVKTLRRKEGKSPLLPPPEERAKIKEDYLAGKLKIKV